MPHSIYKMLHLGDHMPINAIIQLANKNITTRKDHELVLTRKANKCRVCIDYRKLNQATRKDHFPLTLTYQVVERLARKPFYCILDGFSSYMQIHIALKYQHKITFKCPFGTFAYTRMPYGLCNAPATFQRYTMSNFAKLIEKTAWKCLWMTS